MKLPLPSDRTKSGICRDPKRTQITPEIPFAFPIRNSRSYAQAKNLAFVPSRRTARLAGVETAPPLLAEAPALPPQIEVAGLTKLYGDFTAVSDLSFSVRAGDVIGLVGPNGAGKTTTLRCLSGIIPATRGTVRIGGFDLAQNPIEAKRRLAFFSDEPRLFDYLTVAQHLAFTARIYGVANYEEIGRPLLEELEMADKRDKLPSELSRGMKQKLAIACGLLHSPEVIFF